MVTFKYGYNSEQNLNTCDDRLVLVFRRALELGLMDISIIQGRRGKSEQNRYFTLGKSQVQWPNSKHNFIPSKAVDAAPYINGASGDYKHCIHLAGIILTVAKYEGIRMRWGGNWDMDSEPVTDQEFQDLWHYELL